LTSAVYQGINGHTYGFYSVATDNAGNSQATPAGAQASTTVNAGLLSLLTSPTNQVINVGQKVTFSASATGTPTPSVQWQVSLDGGQTYSNISGATSTTLSFTATAGQNGQLYRAVFSNSSYQLSTPAARLTVNANLQLGTLAQTLTVAQGTTVTITTAASSNPAALVQWYVSTNKGKTYSPIPGANSLTLTFTAQQSDSGNLYQAIFTSTHSSTKTAAVTLTVDLPPAVISQPASVSVAAGKKATFSAAASGTPAATVQWQVSTDGGKTFTNIQGATAANLMLNNVAASQNGYEYRAVFTNPVGQVASKAVTLTVTSAPVVTARPTSKSVVTGQER
jgi:hypothetical protein